MGVRDLAAPAGEPLAVGPQIRESVRWSDVDTMGVVFFARYLRFMEIAEDEFFRAIGWPYDRVHGEGGVWIARVHLAMDYRAPAKLDDEIVCRAELRKVGASSMRFAFPIDRAGGGRLVDGSLVLACLDRTTLKSVRIPRGLAAALRGA